MENITPRMSLFDIYPERFIIPQRRIGPKLTGLDPNLISITLVDNSATVNNDASSNSKKMFYFIGGAVFLIVVSLLLYKTSKSEAEKKNEIWR